MEKAIFELNDKLKHPSDIDNKIATILERCRVEKESIVESRTRQYVSELNEIKARHMTLKEMQEKMKSLKILKSECEAKLKSNRYAINEYNTIKAIAIAHENFGRVKTLMENLKHAEDEIDVEDLDEYAKKVFEKDELLCDMKQFGYGLGNEEARIVERKINHLRKTSLEFTSLLLQLSTDYTSNIGLAGKIERIVDREERRDAIARNVKDGEESKDPVARQYYLEFERYINFDPKDLRSRIVNSIESGIKSKFERLKSDKEFLGKLDFIFSDLEAVQHNCLSFFSFNDFIVVYHSSLRRLFDQKAKDIKPEDILGLVEFKTRYYSAIQKNFNRIPESLGAVLLENESELLQKYTVIASERLKTWIENITTTELQKFGARDPEINRDEQNKLVSSGFINLLQIIRAQLEPVSFNRKTFRILTEALKQNCLKFEKGIGRAMKAELKLILDGKEPHGFEDYCIVFGNSGLRLNRYISSLPFFQCDEVRELQQIFLGILRVSNSVLVQYMIKTCEPVFSKLFTKDWPKKQQVLFVTLEDFLQDYKKAMTEYMFTTLLCELCNGLYGVYKTALISPTVQLNARISEWIKEDVRKIKGLLGKYASESEFGGFLISILKMCPLVEAVGAELLIVEIKSLMLEDSEIDKDFITSVLARKTDMDEDEKKAVLAALPELFQRKKNKKQGIIAKFLKK